MIKFTWGLKDSNGLRATGLSPTIQIQRDSDSYYWNGSDWQVGSIDLSMLEFGKGIYYYNFTGRLCDVYVFFDELTIPRYSEAFYEWWELLPRIDALNRLVKDKVCDAQGRLTSCKWFLSDQADIEGDALMSFQITITYAGQSREPITWKAVKL